jgi:ABC-2 type transport system permease protein
MHLMSEVHLSERASPAAAGSVSPLWLLIRTNTLQSWRRVKAIRDQSRLLTALIGLFVVGYVAVAYVLFVKGLRFLATFPGLGTLLIERLLFLLFAFLFMLLLFSNLVISYTNLFRNRETHFLLTLPVSPQTIYRWKFLESTLLASWAFVFLIAPLLVAYGQTQKAPWHFYPMTLVLIALFIVLPAVVGSWLAVNLARHLDRRSFQVAALAVAVLLLAGAAIWLKPEPVADESLETRVLAVMDRLLMKTHFAHFPLLPSYWLSSGVMQWSEGAWTAAGFYLLLLLSYALFLGSLAFVGMGNLFYDAASTVQSRGSAFDQWRWFRAWQTRRDHAVASIGVVERAIGLLVWVRADVRALLLKDVRMFWRDTTQWGQSIVLFGLLGVYILNLRHFSQQSSHPFWTYLVSYLNLGACSLNLATLTTRFVYPQFSLEGKRLWIIGMAPLGMIRVVKAKFWLTGCAALTVTLGLIWLSCHMLQMPASRTLYFALAVTTMTFTLTGLAVGLGVLYPNFKEDNPGKIVSGFGGTFCLVLSFLYILGSVLLLALGSPWAYFGLKSPGWVIATWVGFAALSVALGWLPLKLGLHRVRSLEL